MTRLTTLEDIGLLPKAIEYAGETFEEMSDTHKVDIIDALANNNLVVRNHIKTLQNIQNIL